MSDLRDLEIGLMFWAGEDPVETIREAKSLGARCGQLGISGDISLEGLADSWAAVLRQEQFPIVTVFCGFTGEDYTDISTVQQTVGFIPPATRQEREQRTKDVSDFAAALGVNSIACHIGFVPENKEDPDYQAVLQMVRRICDYARLRGQSFVLETGQEPADVLLLFLTEVDRPNIGINFDPANMIMYGTGDPIQALSVLSPKVVSVHCKDGEWPVKDVPHALGTERPLGEGAVGMEAFIAKLKQVGYTGTLNIEHEIEDRELRKRNVRAGVELLERLRAQG
ncbi:MAG TPA: sugar phosphate isomerase/epimerase family protein [Bryobacteraceae bacterium]|nr:sugar phosphate isomerase/epimerase family protein [Bryobacteraceae bacterium]